MKKAASILAACVLFFGLFSCQRAPQDQAGPEIQDIQTSANILVISDCPSTSVEISARVTDASGVKEVLLRYRIASDREFVSMPMQAQDDVYSLSLKGEDFLGHGYGTIDFYVRAQDTVGNVSQSEVNRTIQFLPCVNSCFPDSIYSLLTF